MRDFPFWHNALKTAKTSFALEAVAADLGAFQNQPTLIADDEKKLTEPQLKSLRELYSSRKKILAKEALPAHPPDKSKFKN